MARSHVQAPRGEGVGIPPKVKTTSCDGAHPGWFDWVVNNDHVCEGQDWVDWLPTSRHKTIPAAGDTPDWA